ncbi:MAG: hypothetical protein HFI12_05430 [Lachnospiraceae bacterium]|jgi:hypothetical protein|nr:hypothetical protein [Lachnospiraceae bacterium]
MIHIWHEDSTNSATTQFWNFLKNSNIHNILINADIRGFNSNKNLSDYISTYTFDNNDIYHVFIDKVSDNQKALKYYVDIKRNVSVYKNVIVHNLLCFEYLILRFKYFVEWTKPTKDNQLYNSCEIIRKQFIASIDNKEAWIKKNDIVDFIVRRYNIDTSKNNWQRELQFVSSENIATVLLNTMTNGGTIDFGVSKTRLGVCWQCNCCIKYNVSVIGNKKCRIYKYNKQTLDKAKNLWNNTYAKNISKYLDK